MVKLPDYAWFMGMIQFRGQGNIFSGSAGCDPVLGNLESKVFRYRVWIEKNEESIELKAAHYIGMYSYDATDKNIMTEQVFEASQNGIDEAQIWLQAAENAALKAFE